MADFKQGDRVVKMSGVCAGKYGTVNSVRGEGTLNVTFDGERLLRPPAVRRGVVTTFYNTPYGNH